MEKTDQKSAETVDTSTMPSFRDLLLLVGQLNYTWTNTESLLIHLIAGLAPVDKETGAIIFLTLNTSRARIDLVDRLAKRPGVSPLLRRDVIDVMGRLNRASRLRNKYNHCIYEFDEGGHPIGTKLMRIFETRDTIRFARAENLDAKEYGNIKRSIEDLIAINKAIWSLIHQHGFPT